MDPKIMGKELIVWSRSYLFGTRSPKRNSSAISSKKIPAGHLIKLLVVENSFLLLKTFQKRIHTGISVNIYD